MQKAVEDYAVILQGLWCLWLCLLDDIQCLKSMYFVFQVSCDAREV